MKISSNNLGFATIMIAAILAGCSSTPVEESSSSIEDTTVETATLDMEQETESLAVDGAAIEEEPINTADTVFYFEFDKAVLSADARAALIAHAAFLKQYPSDIRLEGHADERGTREYNMALGERRAIAVKEFLVLQGVPGNTIEVISYGEERAASFGSNAAAWRMNRRVELK